MKKRIAILGSTGSIGKTLLKIIDKDKKNFQIILLSSNKNYLGLLAQAKKFAVTRSAARYRSDLRRSHRTPAY